MIVPGGDRLKNIGVDISKKKSVVCIMDEDGKILEESSYTNTLDGAKKFAIMMIQRYGECRAVCESTGNMWLKTYESLERHGIPVKLANPIKTRAIAEAMIKTDTIDAQTLAHLLRTNLVAECYVAPVDIRNKRTLLRHRMNLVHDRVKVRNRVHSLLDKYDLKPPYNDIFGVNGIPWLKSLKLGSDIDDTVLQQCTRHVEYLNDEIARINGIIATEASKTQYVKILMSMTGIDYYTALLLASEIVNIKRFATPAKLVSWAGLCPTIHQSGDSLYHGTIKQGNKKVQWAMIQAANSAARTDIRFRKFYLEISKRQCHQVAITHVANKMMTIIWHMLTHNVLYNERKDELYQRKLKRIEQ